MIQEGCITYYTILVVLLLPMGQHASLAEGVKPNRGTQ